MDNTPSDEVKGYEPDNSVSQNQMQSAADDKSPDKGYPEEKGIQGGKTRKRLKKRSLKKKKTVKRRKSRKSKK